MNAADITYGGRNCIRFAQLVVLKSSDDVSLDLSNLRISFQVRANDTESPNTLPRRVYNPSESTANAIIREYDRVILIAGRERFKGKNVSGNDPAIKTRAGTQCR